MRLRIDPNLLPSINTPPLEMSSSYERGFSARDSMGPPSSVPYGSSSYVHSPHQPGGRYQGRSPGNRASISSTHDINDVMSDTAFIGEVASTDQPQPLGHFMGAASGVSLTRMVLDAVLRTGPASAPPASNRETMIMPTQVRRESEHFSGSGPTIKIDPSLEGPRSAGPTSASGSDAGVRNGHSPHGHGSSPSYSHRPMNRSPHMPQHRSPANVPALPPPAAVDRLVQVYVDFVQIMLPILHMPTFEKMLARVRGKSADVTDVDIFFVLMVLGELTQNGGERPG